MVASHSALILTSISSCCLLTHTHRGPVGVALPSKGEREMGACVSSRLGKLGEGGEIDVVALCGERKRFMKATIENRYAFADAHYRYMLSLKSMADACRLFASAHASPSPLFIALPQPPSSPPRSTPPCLSLHHHSSSFSSPLSSPSSSSPEISAPVVTGETPATFQAQLPLPEFGWDFFFKPFDDFLAKGATVSRSSDEDLRMVREEEGIPDLDEVDDDGNGKDVVCCIEEETSDDESAVNMVVIRKEKMEEEEGQQQRGLTVIDTPARERDLLDALKDIEDHFIRAYDSGKEVCRMLEANRVQHYSGLEEIKGEE